VQRLAAAVLVAFALAGCGGGASAGGAAPAPAAPTDLGAVAVGDTRSALPSSWKHGAFMEIYVRGYQDSDGDGIGDLRGLISRLDYLRDLGITGLWLMPVNRSQDRDHGYAVTDYRNIERDYGTLADFDELIAQAHARGIGVIIDYVINHSAAQHPLFLNAQSARDNAWRDWYVWSDSPGGGWNIYGSYPWYGTGTGSYFAGFWSQMPDWNLRQPAVLAWHQDNLRFWLNRGVDGFRFDAVGNLVENGPSAWENQPENDAVVAALRQVVQGYENRYMVCESPSASKRFGRPDTCGGAFAFGMQSEIMGAATGDATSISDLAGWLVDAPEGMASFLSNHDFFAGRRPFDQFDGDMTELRLAAATNLLISRTPFLYYGEEIGMGGASSLSGDHQLRTPMSWTAAGGFSTGTPFRAGASNRASHNVAAQLTDPGSLLNFHKSMIALRKSRPSLMTGAYQSPVTAGRALGFTRAIAGGERTLVAFNYGRATTPATLTFTGLPAGSTLQPLWPQGAPAVSADANGQLTLSLAPQTFTVLAVPQ
jgi:glycosidase